VALFSPCLVSPALDIILRTAPRPTVELRWDHQVRRLTKCVIGPCAGDSISSCMTPAFMVMPRRGGTFKIAQRPFRPAFSLLSLRQSAPARLGLQGKLQVLAACRLSLTGRHSAGWAVTLRDGRSGRTRVGPSVALRPNARLLSVPSHLVVRSTVRPAARLAALLSCFRMRSVVVIVSRSTRLNLTQLFEWDAGGMRSDNVPIGRLEGRARSGLYVNCEGLWVVLVVAV
jgi:hypothetical protein